MARKISVAIVGDSSSLERSFRRSSTAAHGFERDIGKAGRGVAAVSLGFAGLGRSLAFASSAFIGAAGLTVGLKDAISGAENLTKAQDSLRTVLGRTGQDVRGLLPAYQQTAKAAAQFGISQADALSGLAKATTLTGNAASAFRAYEEAVVISKATHISFDSALTATSKAQEGITTSLRRYGILVDKTTSGTKQFSIVMSRFGGQARANTSDLDRLRANAANLGAQLGGPLLRAANAAAAGLSDAISHLSGFADRIGQAHTVHAKLRVVWDGVASVGRDLIRAFDAIDWHGIGRAVLAQLEDLGHALQRVNWLGVGRTVGNKLGHALGAIADFIQNVNWSKVGKVILEGIGAAVILVARALPGIMRGLGKIGIALLEASFRIAAGEIKAIGSFIGNKIKDGLEAAFHFLEREGIKLVLKIIEPFSHLPGFLGGGPFQDMKRALQRQLDGMDKAAKKASDSIAGSMSIASQSVAEVAAGRAQQAADRAGPSRTQAGTSDTVQKLIHTATPLATTAAQSTVAKGFTLPFRLLLAQAKAGATAAAKDDITVAKQIRDFIIKAIPKLHGQKLIDAYNELGQVNQQIASAVQSAAKVGKSFAVPLQLQVADARAQALGTSEVGILRRIKQAAERALRSGKLSAQGQIDAWNEIASVNQQLASAAQALAQRGKDFTEPIKLQIALAKAQALGTSQTQILERMKKAAERALKSGKLSAQGQIDAWNEIASINQQLSSSATTALGNFKQASTKALTAGLGLTDAQRKALRERLSQLGPGGTVPGSGVGAGGFVIDPKTGRPVGQSRQQRATFGASSQQLVDKAMRMIASGEAFKEDIKVVVDLDGKTIATSTSKHRHRKSRQNPTQRRGPNAATSTA